MDTVSTEDLSHGSQISLAGIISGKNDRFPLKDLKSTKL